jgi:hypothetical protein
VQAVSDCLDGIDQQQAEIERLRALLKVIQELPRLWRNGRIRAVGDGFAGPLLDEICEAIDKASEDET